MILMITNKIVQNYEVLQEEQLIIAVLRFLSQLKNCKVSVLIRKGSWRLSILYSN